MVYIPALWALKELASWIEYVWPLVPEEAPIKNTPIESIYYSKKYATIIIAFKDGWKINIRERLWYYGKRPPSTNRGLR